MRIPRNTIAQRNNASGSIPILIEGLATGASEAVLMAIHVRGTGKYRYQISPMNTGNRLTHIDYSTYQAEAEGENPMFLAYVQVLESENGEAAWNVAVTDNQNHGAHFDIVVYRQITTNASGLAQIGATFSRRFDL